MKNLLSKISSPALKNTACAVMLSTTLSGCSHKVHNIPVEDASSSWNHTPSTQVLAADKQTPSPQTRAPKRLAPQAVQEIQRQLNSVLARNIPLKIDGIYGPQTQKYITEFQNICMQITQGYTAWYPDANTRAELAYHAKHRHGPDNCGGILLSTTQESNPGILRNFTQNIKQLGCPVIAQEWESLTTFWPPHERAIQRLSYFVHGLPKKENWAMEVAGFTYHRIQTLIAEGNKFEKCASVTIATD